MLGGRRFLFACAVLAAGVLLGLGLYLPFMRLSTLLLIGHGAQEHSLISAAHSLVRSHQAFLGTVLLTLAIFLPLFKLAYLLALPLLPGTWIARAEALAWLGRWWPQDLVALAAAAALVAGQGALLQHTASGAYCFAGAVLAMTLAYTWRRTDRGDRHQEASAAPVTQRGPAFAALVGLAVLAFALGVTQPVVRLGNAGAGSAGQSIVDLVLARQARGETALWVPIAILAMLLPGLRLLYLLTVAAAHGLPSAIGSRTVRFAEALGRPATADTMVLSLGLFYLMQTQAADPVLQPGVYCLAALAALTLAAYAWANLPASAKPPTQKANSNALTPVRAGAKP